jgi:predicted kinase/phosphoglycolate phosphatase-like HAD superfamily hydrolase
MTKAVLFDIDGTLADATHRLHHVTREPKNYDAFFAAVGDDPVIEPVRELAQALDKQGYKLILVSGRSDKVRDLTEEWLARHEVPNHELHMRVDGDYRPDYVVKAEILDGIQADGNEVAFVVDDRPSVVAMWRERGLTCFQCRDWDEAPACQPGLLTLMVGTTGAGKTTWLQSIASTDFGIDPSHVLSSDQFRADLCGDFRDQTKNDAVFAALHAVARTRLSHGLPTVIDATNLRRKDRLAAAALAKGGKVRYIVIDRPNWQKQRDAGWRAELSFDLIAKHEQTLRSQLKDILAGDGMPNVEVIDLRRAA